jgi:glycosyltransferase involved in cell wall biosynthesis
MIIAKTDERMYHKSVEQYVSDKTWKDHISFVYNHPRVEDLLKTGDIFVYSTPSNSNDSLPRAILEAQAVGLPVVTTATAGCAEIIRDAETGFVVPYDANAMARSVLDLIDNPALRKKFGDRAQLVVREMFTWDQMAEHYSKIILKLLNS